MYAVCNEILSQPNNNHNNKTTITIGVSSIGAGGGRAPPDFQKFLQQCTILLKVVH